MDLTHIILEVSMEWDGSHSTDQDHLPQTGLSTTLSNQVGKADTRLSRPLAHLICHHKEGHLKDKVTIPRDNHSLTKDLSMVGPRNGILREGHNMMTNILMLKVEKLWVLCISNR